MTFGEREGETLHQLLHSLFLGKGREADRFHVALAMRFFLEKAEQADTLHEPYPPKFLV